MGALGSILAGLGLAGQSAQGITDPSLNDALSPASGLMVSPHYFQSIEQEGRWKHQLWEFSEGRNLVPPEFNMPATTGNAGQTYTSNPAPGVYSGLKKWPGNWDSPTGDVSVSGGPVLVCRRQSLLTVTIGALSPSPGAVGTALQALGAVSPELMSLVKGTILAPASFTIGATWVVSKTEILAGYAGLFQATGFKSLYGHRAKVDIAGVALGNYIPTAYLIGMTGYINPVGPIFVEFRCAVVVASGLVSPDVIPAYGVWWTRDRSGERKMDLDNNTCWSIDMSNPTMPPQ